MNGKSTYDEKLKPSRRRIGDGLVKICGRAKRGALQPGDAEDLVEREKERPHTRLGDRL
jgi:hypothetical protein